jgi:molecular chaperone GrpE (heat shock protein)
MTTNTPPPPDWTAPLIGPLREAGQQLAKTISDQLAERVGQLLPDFDTQSKQTAYALDGIRSRLDDSASYAELLDNANQTNRLLGEQFYDERLIQPMTRGLFPMVDLLHQTMEKTDGDQANLIALHTQLEQFLAQYGVRSFQHDALSEFDPRIMKPLQSSVTNDPQIDGLLAESLQCGFRTPERILRLETVSLYRFDINASTSNSLKKEETS